MHLRSRNDGLPPYEHANLAEDARFAVMVLEPVQSHGGITNISRLARRTPMRDVYVVPKSGDLPLHRAPTETSSVSKVVLDLIFNPNRPLGMIEFLLILFRSIEKIATTLQDYRAVLQKLFPTLHPDSLLNVSRERLLELLSQTSPLQPLSPTFSQGVDAKPSPPNPEAGSLEALQTMPEEASDTTDTKSNGVPGISDDVNALSLSVKQSSSYLGISSVIAALRVICYLDPEAQSAFIKTPDRSALSSRDHSIPPEANDADPGIINPWDEVPIINAYFVYVHAFIPLIEEQTFRETYMSGRRQDSRWLALLNVVLAMGSMAASTSDDKGHRVYYNRAMQYLGFDTIGSAHLETVQTLALLGGFYLHYIQQPNLAIAVMGATLRLATTLGLHREYLDGRTQRSPKSRTPSVEMRRRIWWCIFNLDAWASSNLGRPSMGRWGHAITVKPPQFVDVRSA
jgi:hypothetical protein